MKIVAQKSSLLLPFQNVRGSNFILSQTSPALTKLKENILTSTTHNKYTAKYIYFCNFDHYKSLT